MVEVGEHALVLVALELGPEPFHLASVVMAGDPPAVRVERDQPPAAHVVRVPAPAARPGASLALPGAVPVVPIPLRAEVIVVLVVADDRMGDDSPAPPGGLIRRLVAAQRGLVVVGQIAEGKN